MASCKTAVTPLLMQWSYCSLALSHRKVSILTLHEFSLPSYSACVLCCRWWKVPRRYSGSWTPHHKIPVAAAEIQHTTQKSRSPIFQLNHCNYMYSEERAPQISSTGTWSSNEPQRLDYITGTRIVAGWHRDHFVNVPSQREMTLHCNVASHWLCAYTKLSLET